MPGTSGERAFGAPAGYSLPNDAPLTIVCDRTGAGPMTTFSSLCSVGTITRFGPRYAAIRRSQATTSSRRLARTSHQLSAAAGGAPHPAVFSRLGVLGVLSSTTPRPSGRKPHWARHLAILATKAGEKCGLAGLATRPSKAPAHRLNPPGGGRICVNPCDLWAPLGGRAVTLKFEIRNRSRVGVE
jgi:hypothetical protein